ncbi:D-xylose-proton symporter-like 3, chloroplastic [Morella rubra]|uniref:D-xylose-proton symporter-like 3, chloroplastic n=1 Tax=Morella rubra TaxID=262757 RepID=A0A6A1UFA1_9ROSI|nr:D-xylose-proton symporter-like 3, chloroplastic [Morella rubra]
MTELTQRMQSIMLPTHEMVSDFNGQLTVLERKVADMDSGWKKEITAIQEKNSESDEISPALFYKKELTNKDGIWTSEDARENFEKMEALRLQHESKGKSYTEVRSSLRCWDESGLHELGYFVGSFQIDVVGGWCYMFGVSAPVALIMGLGMWSLPPSPRWLLLRAVQRKGLLEDYKDKAILALSKLRGRPPGDKLSERQIEDNVVSLKSAYADQDSEGSFLEVFRGPSLKAFIIGGGLVLFQQVSLTMCYLILILKTARFSAASDATRVSVVIGVFELVYFSMLVPIRYPFSLSKIAILCTIFFGV